VPAFPKKLPTILIVTLGTLILAIATVATLALLAGAPDESVAAGEPRIMSDVAAGDDLTSVAAPSLADESLPLDASDLADAPQPDSIAALAGLLDPGTSDAAHRRTLVVATANALAASGVGLALGRQLAEAGRRVVMVDIDAEEALLSGLAGPSAVGLSDFAAGAAGFGAILHGDPQSAAHLVPAGGMGRPPAEIVEFAVEALARSYEAVVIVAGVLPAAAGDFDALCGLADDAVIVTEEPASDSAVRAAYARLTGAGLKPVVVMLAAEDEVVAA